MYGVIDVGVQCTVPFILGTGTYYRLIQVCCHLIDSYMHHVGETSFVSLFVLELRNKDDQLNEYD